MTTEVQPDEGVSIGSIVAGLIGGALILALAWSAMTGWRPFDFRISLEADTPLLVSVTPKPSETPQATETPVPTATPVRLAPFSGDEAHANYRSAFLTVHKGLTNHVAILTMLADEYGSDLAGDAKWKNTLFTTCNAVAATGKTWVDGVWPPGPYDASNPLTDAHSRLTQAQLGVVLVCANLGSLGESKYDFSWPDPGNIDLVVDLLATASTNLDYAMTGYNLDLYGPR